MSVLRDLGVTIGHQETGRWNAITDVSGVRVGHATVIADGAAPGTEGGGPVRTGCTVILPRSVPVRDTPVFAGTSTLNGNGEMTGLEWVRESGLLTTPIALTNTHSVGVVRDALVAAELPTELTGRFWSMPVVAETYDGVLNDINGQHVRREHVQEALAAAVSGPVGEGSVGGGTGMICHGFKGGVGTSSRCVEAGDERWTVGVLVQANHGRRDDLRVDGVPVTRFPPLSEVPLPLASSSHAPASQRAHPPGAGSIIIIIATDAPLLPDQCERLARRAAIGVARAGAGTSDSSGDIALAFATGNDTIPAEVYDGSRPATFPVRSVSHQRLDGLFDGVADATEESILNALLAASTMTGRDGVTAHALERSDLAAVLGQPPAHRVVGRGAD